MCILYTAFHQLESNTKLRISVEPSGQKNTGKIFTNFRCFYIIFSVLKKARMGRCLGVDMDGFTLKSKTCLLTSKIPAHRAHMMSHLTLQWSDLSNTTYPVFLFKRVYK